MRLSWLAANWPAPPGVIAGTTRRQGGCSRGPYRSLNLAGHVGDDPEGVAANRRLLRESCGLPAEPAWLRQVHGTSVVDAASNAGVAEGDALTTHRSGIVCAVLTADCLPVVFASADGRAVAVAHAGWRGLSAGIIEATVAAMHCAPADLLAWLGPAISQAAFEVGDEVRNQFVSSDPGTARYFVANPRDRWQADLYGLARRRLARCGIAGVYGGGHCTYGEPEAFFSYRRDGTCGRMATFVYKRPENA